jgi:hypothetical protein
MNKTEAKIRDLYRIPCGPMEISADSVCRKGLRDNMDKLLDRLTHEIHPVVIDDADDADGNHAEKELQGNSKLLQDISGKIEKW